MHLTYMKIAGNLNVAVSTVHRINSKFSATGGVGCVVRKRRPQTRRLDVHEELYAIATVLENPSMYLSEICQELKEATGVFVSPSTICRIIRAHGISRKKIQQVALQRCYTLRGAFMAQCFLFHPEQFVFVDETGSDARNHVRK